MQHSACQQGGQQNLNLGIGLRHYISWSVEGIKFLDFEDKVVKKSLVEAAQAAITVQVLISSCQVKFKVEEIKKKRCQRW